MNQSPPEPSPRNNAHGVHFSKRVRRGSNVGGQATILLMYSAIGGAGLVVPLLSMVLPALGAAKWLQIVLSLALGGGAALVVVLYLVRRSRRRTAAQTSLPDEPDDAFRVRVIGAPADLEGDGPLADVPFEPQVFWAGLSLPIPTLHHVLFWVIASVAGMLLTLLPGIGIPIKSAVAGPFPIWFAFGVTMAVYAWFRPIYVRVSPRRLDIVRYRPLRSSPISVETYDVGKLRVLVDTRSSLVYLDDENTGQRRNPGDDPKAKMRPLYGAALLEISTLLIPRRDALHRAIVLAAISSHPAAPLPADELLG